MYYETKLALYRKNLNYGLNSDRSNGPSILVVLSFFIFIMQLYDDPLEGFLGKNPAVLRHCL